MPDLMENRAPILLLAAALAASAALLLCLDSHLTFVGDSWALLVKRQGWSASALLDPFNEHLVLGPALVYKLLVAAFGIGSALPFFAVSISLFLLSAVLLFAYLRPRVGEWLALIATVLVLFLGAASEDLLWEFQMGFFGSVAAGLGMLIALDRQSRGGDRAACGLLAISVAFSGLGIAFVAAALADLARGRRPRGRRAYVAPLPLALYGLWWLGWGHSAGSNVGLENLEQLPRYVFDAAAAGIAALLGREPAAAHGHPPLLGQLLLVGLLTLAALRIARDRELSRGLAVALTLGLAFWILSGLDHTAGRYATSSRYQYPSAVFLLLIAAELLRGVRIPRLAAVAMAALTAAAVFGGMSLLQREYTHTWKPATDDLRSMLAAIDIAGDSARPGYRLNFPPSIAVPADTYLAASRNHDSPAFSEAELLARPGPERQNADATLAGALGLTLAPPSREGAARTCRVLRPTADGAPTELRPGTFTVTNGGPADAELRLGRFAHGFPVQLGPLPSGRTRALAIPADGSPRPWRLLTAGGPIRLCSKNYKFLPVSRAIYLK